jgi:tetratricopeptide (TPR) repeat protein
MQKAWRRHKATFVVGASLVLAVVAAGVGLGAWQSVRAARAENLAKQRQVESEAVDKFLEEVFESREISSESGAAGLARTLNAAAKRLETGFADQPARRAKLQSVLVTTYLGSGLFGEAVELQEKIFNYNRRAAGPEAPGTLEAMQNLANCYYAAGRGGNNAGALKKALELREEMLPLRRKASGRDSPMTIRAMEDLASSYGSEHRTEDALKLRETALALCRKTFGQDSRETREAMTPVANGLRGLANSCFGDGREKEAIAYLEKHCKMNLGDTGCWLELALWQAWLGQDADYETTRARMLDRAQSIDPDEPGGRVAINRAARAFCVMPSTNRARLVKTVELARITVEQGKGDKLLPQFYEAAGLAEYRNGRYAEAEEDLIAAEKTVPPGSNEAGSIQGTGQMFRAMSLFRHGRGEEARRLFARAEAQMPGFPEDKSHPFSGRSSRDPDTLALWLAYREAKATLKIPDAK